MSEFYSPVFVENPHITRLGRIIVEICDEEYDICEKTSWNLWSSEKAGPYGKGLINTEEEPRLAERVGMFGQMAFGKVFGEPVDITYRKGGDKQDFFIGKYRIDVKCASRNSGKCLVYRISPGGSWISLDKDIYVGGYMNSEDKVNHKAKIVLAGFALRKDVAKCPLCPGEAGGFHHNHEIAFTSMRSIVGFLKLKKRVRVGV